MTTYQTKINHHDTFSGTFAVATADITPPLAIYARNWGAAQHDQAESVHKPLMMQCLLMESVADERLLLITADLGWWKNRADEQKLRDHILQTLDLRAEQVLICLSHTHAGPSICSTDHDKPGGEFIAPYLALLADTAVRLIEQTMTMKQDGTLTWGYGTCDLATKRDYAIDGRYLIGYDPEAVADDTVAVGVVRDTKGVHLATLVNYACHPTTFAHENRMLSPDYIGAMREVVEDYTGSPCLFLQGASGDLAPAHQYVADPAIVDSHGRRLGYAAIAAIESIPPNNSTLAFEGELLSGAPLAMWRPQPKEPDYRMGKQILHVEVAYKDLPGIDELMEAYEACDDRVLKDRLWRKINTRRGIGDHKTVQISIWIWQLGNSLVIGQANEAYSIIQEQLRATFPGRNITFINIANGYVGYLPPAELYDKDIYAVWQTPYAQGSLEKVTEEIINAIQTLNS
jgi:hypothetical protein